MYKAREVTTRGIVLLCRGVGEGSTRALLYTDVLGLVSILLTSGKEERSKLRPHLQEGTFGVYRLVKGRDVWRVTGATQTENIYFSLQEHTRGKEAVARVLSSVRQFVHGEGADPRLFSILWDFISSMMHIGRAELPEAESIAVLRILAALGYVSESVHVNPFLHTSYEHETLVSAKAARPTLIRIINEAIATTGLS